MYSIIAHEFGHPLWDLRRGALQGIFYNVFIDTLLEVVQDAGASAELLLGSIIHICILAAEECFADLVAAKVMGPAYALSLHEFVWTEDRNTWGVRIVGTGKIARSYPSINYRIRLVAKYSNAERFELEASESFMGSKHAALATCISDATREEEPDGTHVAHPGNHEWDEIAKYFEMFLPKIQRAMDRFCVRASNYIDKQYPGGWDQVRASDVAALLSRLDADIPPNIVPNGTLLGRAAPFQTILAASGIFRLGLVKNHADHGNYAVLELGKVDRLAAKALEASFVQLGFLKDLNHGNPDGNAN